MYRNMFVVLGLLSLLSGFLLGGCASPAKPVPTASAPPAESSLSGAIMPSPAQAHLNLRFAEPPPLPPPVNRENYANFDDNPTKQVSEHPVSTFSIDVDTGAYANVRRWLNNGQLPQ
ncbi:MAG TPA: hypothetical protein ENI48_07350, partial [Thioploca sp.]|nr:hypothetical protein [Thioploca sp.]